jgi:hypothetical protein
VHNEVEVDVPLLDNVAVNQSLFVSFIILSVMVI